MIYDIEKIIHKIYDIPQLKKLSNYRCFDSILNSLDTNLKNKVSNMSYKYGYIYISVKHPAVKMALQYKLERFDNILDIDKKCKYIKGHFKGFSIKIDEDL